MASVKEPPKEPKKPSRVLGFLLFAVPSVTLAFAAWEFAGHRQFIVDNPPADLDKAQWVVLLGVVAAVTGWIISAIVTMRNSIRQHTITTLLSSRLSETYMSQTRLVNARYFSANGRIHVLTEEELTAGPPEAQLGALRYLLNYFEFIAVGIRYGDLDEILLKNTLRSILCSVYEASEPLVRQRRELPSAVTEQPEATVSKEVAEAAPSVRDGLGKTGSGKSKTFEHLEWLYNRWFIPDLRRKVAPRPLPTLSAPPHP